MGTRRRPAFQLKSANTALGKSDKMLEHSLFTYGSITGTTDLDRAQITFYGNWLSQTVNAAATNHQPMGTDQLAARYKDVRVLETTFELYLQPNCLDTSEAQHVGLPLAINVLPVIIDDYLTEIIVSNGYHDMERVGAMTKMRIPKLGEINGENDGTNTATNGNPGLSKIVFRLKTKDVLPTSTRSELTQHDITANQSSNPPTHLWGVRVVVSQVDGQADTTVSFNWILKRVQKVVWSNRVKAVGS